MIIMLRLKADSSKLSQNGSVPNDLFADISTRSLNSVIVGENSGKISQGTANAFVGFECGNQNMDGSFGVFIGYQAGQFNKNGNWNTFVGSYTGRQNSRGQQNTFVGFRAGELNLDGNECVAIGANAMRENSVGNRNVAVGISAGERILEGDNNTMIGAESGQNIRSGNLNTMAGYRSGKGSFKGNENTYFGAYSGYSNEFGDGNAFIGYKSGEYLTDGSYNVAVGANTLQYATSGSCNIAIGAFSGSKLSGMGNVLVGTGAAGNTKNANYNTNIGTNAGNTANGDNNVYIGYEAAKNTFGDKNVVIGSSAFSSNNSSNSVIIGFNTGDTVFKSGCNNIFIGVGADSHTSKASFAIAIGSENTRAGDKSISIGEHIENGGQNSLLLGYDMYSDSDQCVSIGYQTQINNVIVFNDPLNYLFPVNSNTFNLKENYTDMLFLNGLSNTVAIASINTKNIYDSGSNVLKGSVTKDLVIDLLSYFNSNIIYHNVTILHTGSNSTAPFVNSNLQIPYNFQINSNLTQCNIPIPIRADGLNLIPTSATSFDYKYVIGRRLSIDSLELSNSYTLSNNKLSGNIFLDNIKFKPIVLNSFETSNFFDKSSNILSIRQYPEYGDLVFQNNTISYRSYPEALFADTDTFKVAIATKMGEYTILSEDIPEITILFANRTVPLNSNINFHPDKETIVDFTYYADIAIEPPTDYFSNVQKAVSYSNITVETNTFSLDVIQIPINIEYIIDYPMYGTIDIGSNTYNPATFNFTKDTFKVFSNDTIFTIDALTNKGPFKYQYLNTQIKPATTSNTYTTNTELQQVTYYRPPLLTSVTNTYSSNLIVTSNTVYVAHTSPYDDILGYIHTSNISTVASITEWDYDSFYNTYNVIQSNENYPYYDYYAYKPVGSGNPFLITIQKYAWDYNFINGIDTNPNATSFFDQDQIAGTEQAFTNINNLNENRYFEIAEERTVITIIYKHSSNITITSSNISYSNVSYVDNYNNYIYTDRYQISSEPIITSNISLASSLQETETLIGYSNDFYITSNISTLQLQDTTFYEYNGVYTVDPFKNSNVILQKNKGAVARFHQSNITNKEIHIWGRCNLMLFSNIEVPINYYSNLDEVEDDSPFGTLDFRRKDDYYYDNSAVITHMENIAFLSNSACVSGGDVLIRYIIESSNISATAQVPSTYMILNPINLNIGLKKVATTLKPTELFYSQEITYALPDLQTTTFYKNNVATNTFTQSDINKGLITIEGLEGTETVTLQIGVSNYDLIINKYIQNDYIHSSNASSNEIIQSNNGYYEHRFNGPLWEDLDHRRDDVTIHILNNPVGGFLYSSNTATIVNKIGYRDFKTEKIHYIPYAPMDLSPGTIDLYLSYSNVVSPVYSVHLQSTFSNQERPIDKTIVQRVNFINSNILIDVDESSYTYFDKLIEQFVNRDVIFYIITPPQHGVILNRSFVSVATFSSRDILNKSVFYQNYKGTGADTFQIKVATNIYDLSLNTATVTLRLLPSPKLSKNNYDYIYSDSIAYGKSNYYPLGGNSLEISSGGIRIIEKEYLNVYVKDSNGVYNTRDYFTKGEDVYYRPSNEFFEFNSNENKPMKLGFFTYSNESVRELTPLSQLDIYKNVYNLQYWYSKYNTYDSSNEFISVINANQRISYTKEDNDYMFKNKKCKIQFDYLPFKSSVIDLKKQFGDKYNGFLKTYAFSLTLSDFNGDALIELNFDNEKIVANILGRASNELPTGIDTVDFSRFYMINNDDTNDDKLSIYINDVNYTDYNTNPVESIDLENLKEIVINVPITDSKNYYNESFVKEINTDGSKLYYNLQNYNTTIHFKNLQILLGIYDLTTQLLDENSIYKTTYNIAIGDYLRVNGFNNICIGKNFLTTGTGSIIIGNDIGSKPNTTSMLSQSFNEVFNSIIISTSSFIETKVRDVIAIGTNIFNNAGGSADIDLFFSKKPVLIGNDITPATIDFHVNIQNSFLKTDVGYKQLYCGLEQEAVCIGYSSNVLCNNELSKLYVNGNVNVNGTIIERSFDTYRTRYVYPARKMTTGVYRITIRWEKNSVDIHDILTAECKFKFIGNATNYGYYNFESVILASSNTQLYSITHSVRGNNMTHTVEPFEKGAVITIRWDAVAFTDYLLATMEVETVSLNTLGNLVFA